MAAVETDADREAIEAYNNKGDEVDLESEAADGDVEEEDDGQFMIAGTKSSLTSSAGGRRPDTSRSKIRSITLPTQGQYEKGEVLRVTMDVRVKGVGFDDEEDQHGHTIRTMRTHTFTPQAIIEIGPAPTE